MHQNHRHYRNRIPLYRQIADRAGVNDDASFDVLAPRCFFPTESSSPTPSRFSTSATLTAWIDGSGQSSTTISNHPPTTRPEYETVDDWLASLEDRGIHACTARVRAGISPFVPRDDYSWWLFREGPHYYVPLLLARRGIVGQVKSSLAAFAGRTLSPPASGRFSTDSASATLMASSSTSVAATRVLNSSVKNSLNASARQISSIRPIFPRPQSAPSREGKLVPPNEREPNLPRRNCPAQGRELRADDPCDAERNR